VHFQEHHAKRIIVFVPLFTVCCPYSSSLEIPYMNSIEFEENRDDGPKELIQLHGVELEVRFRHGQSHCGDAEGSGRARPGPPGRPARVPSPGAAPGGTSGSAVPLPHSAFSLGFIIILRTSIFVFSFRLMRFAFSVL
jgi:hypothetical protein